MTVGIKLAAADHATNALRRKITKALKRKIICRGSRSPEQGEFCQAPSTLRPGNLKTELYFSG